MTPEHDSLIQMLTRLKLTAIRDQLDNLIDEGAGCGPSVVPAREPAIRTGCDHDHIKPRGR
jgi:hypothetical protein